MVYGETCGIVAENRSVLKELGREHPLVLVSNFYGNMPTVLGEFGLDGLFVSVVESAVVGIRKPDPRIFALGVDALQLPARDVTVVGDSYYKDILPARSLGCRTVWIKGLGWTDEEYDLTVPDKVISRLDELL